MLMLKPAGLGQGDDFVVLDDDRLEIGRMLWTHAAASYTPWFWTITARAPQSTHVHTFLPEIRGKIVVL